MADLLNDTREEVKLKLQNELWPLLMKYHNPNELLVKNGVVIEGDHSIDGWGHGRLSDSIKLNGEYKPAKLAEWNAKNRSSHPQFRHIAWMIRTASIMQLNDMDTGTFNIREEILKLRVDSKEGFKLYDYRTKDAVPAIFPSGVVAYCLDTQLSNSFNISLNLYKFGNNDGNSRFHRTNLNGKAFLIECLMGILKYYASEYFTLEFDSNRSIHMIIRRIIQIALNITEHLDYENGLPNCVAHERALHDRSNGYAGMVVRTFNKVLNLTSKLHESHFYCLHIERDIKEAIVKILVNTPIEQDTNIPWELAPAMLWAAKSGYFPDWEEVFEYNASEMMQEFLNFKLPSIFPLPEYASVLSDFLLDSPDR